MRTLRSFYRVLRILLFVYGFWNTLLRSRWFAIMLAVVRIVRKRRARDRQPTAALKFVSAREPAIYHREGWRRIRIRE